MNRIISCLPVVGLGFLLLTSSASPASASCIFPEPWICVPGAATYVLAQDGDEFVVERVLREDVECPLDEGEAVLAAPVMVSARSDDEETVPLSEGSRLLVGVECGEVLDTIYLEPSSWAWSDASANEWPVHEVVAANRGSRDACLQWVEEQQGPCDDHGEGEVDDAGCSIAGGNADDRGSWGMLLLTVFGLAAARVLRR